MPPTRRNLSLLSKRETKNSAISNKGRNIPSCESMQNDDGVARKRDNNDIHASDLESSNSGMNEPLGKEQREGEHESERLNMPKLTGLSHKALVARNAAVEKTGIVYLSRIPPFMKPQKIGHLLSQYGEIGRVFLTPEDPKRYARRVRLGGNKKKTYTEGWVEFKDKKKARLVASSLNATIIGGKKRNFYHDDLWSLKYLPKFKWHHLTEQIAYENASRQSRMRAELSQATRENKMFIKNVERGKMIAKMKAQKKQQPGSNAVTEPLDVRRLFKQRKIVQGPALETSRGATELQRVLGNLFA